MLRVLDHLPDGEAGDQLLARGDDVQSASDLVDLGRPIIVERRLRLCALRRRRIDQRPRVGDVDRLARRHPSRLPGSAPLPGALGAHGSSSSSSPGRAAIPCLRMRSLKCLRSMPASRAATEMLLLCSRRSASMYWLSKLEMTLPLASLKERLVSACAMLDASGVSS